MPPAARGAGDKVIALGAGLLFQGAAIAAEFRKLVVVTPATVKSGTSELGGGLSAQVLVGIGAIILGILALIGFATQVLNLIAMLALGCSTLLSGSAVASRVLTAFHS